jgi:hypothetical protein
MQRPWNRARIVPAILFLACGSLILGHASAFAQQPSRSVVDLSAGKAADVFKVPPKVWTDIDTFVFLIGFDIQGAAINVEYAKRFRELPTYQRLYAATRKWREETFPLLQNLATELAKGDIKPLLEGLSNSLKERKTDPVGSQTSFDRYLGQLNQRFQRLGDLTNPATAQAKELDGATRAAVLEYRSQNLPEISWIGLGPKLEDVQGALAQMNGQWGALISDLQDLQGLMAKNKLDDVDVDVGLLTWDDISKTAKGFVTSIPEQMRFLSGDNYYANACYFQENASYHLINFLTEPKDYALTYTGGGLEMMQRGNRRDNRQAWQFKKADPGWFKITNKSKGPSFALDVDNLAPAGGFTGQFWRCLPAPAAGWVRLINSYNGELLSLGTNGTPVVVKMMSTANFKGQYWRFSNNGP